MSIQARILLCLVLCIASFVAGCRVTSWKDAAAQKQAEDQLLAKITAIQASNDILGAQVQEYTQKIEAARVAAQVKLGESYAKNPTYRDCVINSDDRLQLVAAAGKSANSR